MVFLRAARFESPNQQPKPPNLPLVDFMNHGNPLPKSFVTRNSHRIYVPIDILMSRLQVLRICSVCGRHFCLSEMALAVFVELLSCDDSDLGPISWACKCSKLEVQYVFDQLRSQDIGINQGVPVLMEERKKPYFSAIKVKDMAFLLLNGEVPKLIWIFISLHTVGDNPVIHQVGCCVTQQFGPSTAVIQSWFNSLKHIFHITCL